MTRCASKLTRMPITFNESVAREVRAEMARRRWGQHAMAARLGWSQAFLSRRLTGRTPFSTHDLEKVAAALEVPVAQLIQPAHPAGQAAST